VTNLVLVILGSTKEIFSDLARSCQDILQGYHYLRMRGSFNCCTVGCSKLSIT